MAFCYFRFPNYEKEWRHGCAVFHIIRPSPLLPTTSGRKIILGKEMNNRYLDPAISGKERLTRAYGCGGGNLTNMVDLTNWNMEYGCQGYWLLGSSVVLIILGIFLLARKPF
jgi:hypothetical protein